MEELNLNNILSESEIENLFGETGETQETEPTAQEPQGNDEGKNKTTEEKEEPIDVEGLFENPESVGSEKKDEAPEGAPSGGTEPSPKSNLYSSTLSALLEDGALDGLSEEDIKDVSDVEAFVKAIEKSITSRFDERQRKIDEALNYGVEPSEIKKHENLLAYLDSITEEQLKAETPEGETLRKNLIAQDLLNKGYKEDRIQRELKRSFDSANDIDDAIEALSENKEFFQEKYNDLIKAGKERAAEEERKREEKSSALKKDIEETEKLFGDVVIDKSTRAKIYDNITKPVYKDPKTGKMLTAIQRYQSENESDFIKNVGILYTLTDGFKSIDKLVNTKVKKEVKKSLRELEHTLNNTARHSDGSLNYASGVSDDNSYIGAGLRLDI